MKIALGNCASYKWGKGCTAWHLVNNPDLSVIRELMPPGSQEQKHKHLKSQQFFYILKGCATFLVDGEEVIVAANEGVHIPPRTIHHIRNHTAEDLEFLVISQPHAHGDRESVV